MVVVAPDPRRDRTLDRPRSAAGRRPGGLVLAVTFGAIVGGIASTGSLGFRGICSGDSDRGTAFAETSGRLADRARATIKQDCGDLMVTMAPGSTWSLSGVASDGRQPRVDARPDVLTIDSSESTSFGFGGRTAWAVVLPRDPLLDLDIEANAGDGRLTPAGARLTRLSIERNAGSVDIDLREIAAVDKLTVDINAGSGTLRLPALSVDGALSVNAGSIAICSAPGTGLRIRLEGSFAAANDFDEHGMTEVGGVWETAGYATAEIRIALRADVNAGSLSLDPVRTCAG